MPRRPRQDGLFEPGLFLQFFLAAQPIGRLIEQAIHDSEMSAAEYAVLSAVDELAPVTPADIARLTGVPRPTLTAHIERLTAAGHIERRPNPSDGRSYLLDLTVRGAQTMKTNGRALLAAQQALELHLPAGSRELTAMLGQLRAAAEAAADERR